MDDCIMRAECLACQGRYDEVNNSQNRRLDSLEEEVKQIYSLAISVEKMAGSLEQMAKELSKQGQRLDRIESEPGEKWKQASWLVLSIIVTALITYFLTSIGVK